MALFYFSLPVIVGLALGMFLMMELGRGVGRWHLRTGRGSIKDWLGVVDGPIFAIFGLLIAFTFSSAISRFDDRRKLIVEEANAIGTAYLRLDLLAPPDRNDLQDKFRKYVDSRLKTYALFPDMNAVLEEYCHSQLLQSQIWSGAVAAAGKTSTPPASMLLLPALNSMIDITTARTAATQFHPPLIIYGMLFIMSLVAALLAGYQMASTAKRSWLHMTLFILCITLASYVILDIEYPRLGFIRVDSADSILKDVRDSFGQ